MYADIETYASVPQELAMDSSRTRHRTLCPKCHRKLDPSWINPSFRVRNRRRDIAATYDGYTLVSDNFRAAWRQWGHPGAVFLDLPNDPKYQALQSNQIVPFDSEWRGTRFEDYCETCREYATVVGATPARLKGIKTPLPPGLYRTDISFACGIEQHPLLIVDTLSYSLLRSKKLVGLEFKPIEA
jgi:hypothetical protein